jgi:hypothetical protein
VRQQPDGQDLPEELVQEVNGVWIWYFFSSFWGEVGCSVF